MSNNSDEIKTAGQPKPQPAAETERTRLSIIGIGASAGGLTALRAFFNALPDHNGLTFVVIVHLSPEHESMLAPLLQPYTAMPVMQVTESVEMQTEHVYVIPPGKRMVVRGNRLELIDFEEIAGARRTYFMQIDAFFRSLAENHGDGGAVILSGSGSDGAVGIQAIKEKGGLLLAQLPEEAEYDGMPRSAIATGLIDIVAPVAELATQLVAAKQMRDTLQLPADGEALSEPMQQTLNQVLAQLRVRTGHDFNGYKQATLLRRLARRMQITQVTTLTAYLQRLRQDSSEADLLLRDLLINVTEFFRDHEAWSALETNVIPQLFTGKGRDDTVRVWTVGCATGEEAYSVAMLLLESVSELVAPPTIQIFASDLGQAALDFAREGVYPAAIADDIAANRLARFFTKENSHYRVRPELRETILFTQHNLLQDPPFSRLDLIICRNLLIYIQRDLQEKVFETFYYALRGDATQRGFLFLGNAESAEGATDLFDTLDKRHRLYQRRAREHALPILPSLPLLHHSTRLPPTEHEAPRTPHLSAGAEHQRLLELNAPPSLLVDRNYNVLHFSESAGRYLLTPGGPPTTDLLKLVRPELQSELRAALVRAFEENKAISTRPVPVRFNGAPHPVYLMLRPHLSSEGVLQALIFFLEDETPVTADLDVASLGNTNDTVRKQLEGDLRHVQNRLQSMREEYETTVEELRAANEELQSTNEEYKSTLEELETSKEELQSINEELQTINQELKTKIDEVTHAHSDVQNLVIATEIATLFLDRDLRVKRYTPPAAELFNLMPPDRGRPIAHLRSNLRYSELESDAQRVLANLVPIEREAKSQDGRSFLTRVRPYRTLEDKIDGVVITFIDITSNKSDEEALLNAKEYAESIVHTIPDALLVLDPDLRVKMANDAFYEIFQVKRETTEGQLIYELGNNQWQIPALRTLLEDILPENKLFIGYEVDHTFESIGRRTMLLNGRRLDHAQLILLAIADITERKKAEDAVRRSEQQFSAFVNATSDIVYEMSADWREMYFLQGKTFIASTENPRSDWMEAYIPEEEQSHVWAVINQAIANKSNFELEHRVILLDGTIGWTFSRAVPLLDERGEVVKWFGAAGDITERKHQQQQQAFLLEFSDALRAQPDAQTIAQVSLQMLAEFMRLDRAYIANVWMAEDRAEIGPEYRRADLMPISGTLHMSDFPEGFRQVEAGTLVVNNIAAAPPLSELDQQSFGAINLTAFVVASVRKGEQDVIWSLVAATTVPRTWKADEIVLLETVAERTWAALERAKVEAALRENEVRHRTLFASIDEGVCLFERMPLRPDGRRDYRYVAMNPVMQAMFGIPDLSGQSIRDNFPNEVEAWYDDYDRVLETGQPLRFERESKPQGMVLEMFVTRVEDGSEKQLLAVMQDVTERKRREANLAFLAELSMDFAPFALADELMRKLCEKLADYLTLSRCDLSEVDEASDRIITLYDWRRDADAPSVLGEHAISTFLTPTAREHYAAGNMAVINDTHHDPMINAAPEMMDALRIRAVVDSPYLENGVWKFLISLCRSEVTEWRADEIELIREATERIYIRLRRARAEEALRESEERQAFLLRLSDALRPLSDPVEIQNQAARLLGEHLGADRVGYAEAQGDSDTMVVTRNYVHGVPGLEDRYPYEDYSSELLQELRAGARVVRSDIANDSALTEAEKAAHAALQLGSTVNLPLVKAGRLVAILFVHCKEAHTWRATDLEMMQETADRTWSAVEQARAEERLRQREAELARVQRIGGVGGLDIDVTNGLIGRRSPEYQQLHGIPSAAIEETHEEWLQRIHPEDREQAEQTLLNVLAGTDTRYENEYRIIRPIDGQLRWIAAVATVERDREGRPTRLIGAHIDITERKHTEEALRQSEERLKLAISIDTVGVLFFTLDGRILDANQAFLNMSGYSRDELRNILHWEALTAPEYLDVTAQAAGNMMTRGETDPYEKVMVRKDGSRWWSLCAPKRLRVTERDGECVEFLIDITERKAAEMALQQLNITLEQEVNTRTAQVRELASTLTLAEQKERRRLSQFLHDDLQQLLYGVQMRLVSLMQDIDTKVPSTVIHHVEETDSWLTQAIQMVRELTVDLSPPVLKGEGLTDALRWLVRQMQEVNGLRVELLAPHSFRLPSEDMRVLLFQIVRELLFNVVKHSGTDHARVELQDGLPGILRILISDQGRGFDPNKLAAKQDGGFGLFSIRERLDLFGGHMEIQSTPGQGARVTLTVPVGVSS